MFQRDERKPRIEPAERPSRGIVDPGEAVARAAGFERSPEWEAVARAHLQREPRCVCCGPTAKVGQAVQVHHVRPFHFCVALGRPDLELDERNLITLCQSERGRPEQDHHLLVGHLDSFESANLDVRRDATRVFNGMSAEEIRASKRWAELVRQRIKPLGELSEGERRELRREMDRVVPRR